jgi:hypothetical protein
LRVVLNVNPKRKPKNWNFLKPAEKLLPIVAPVPEPPKQKPKTEVVVNIFSAVKEAEQQEISYLIASENWNKKQEKSLSGIASIQIDEQETTCLKGKFVRSKKENNKLTIILLCILLFLNILVLRREKKIIRFLNQHSKLLEVISTKYKSLNFYKETKLSGLKSAKTQAAKTQLKTVQKNASVIINSKRVKQIDPKVQTQQSTVQPINQDTDDLSIIQLSTLNPKALDDVQLGRKVKNKYEDAFFTEGNGAIYKGRQQSP